MTKVERTAPQAVASGEARGPHRAQRGYRANVPLVVLLGNVPTKQVGVAIRDLHAP